MEFLRQYLKIINYALIGLVFSFASFYLLSNAYHYLEIRKDYTIIDFNTQPLVEKLEEKLNRVNKNIEAFAGNNYHGPISINQMQVIYYNLKSCVDNFHNDTFQSIINKNKVTIIDVYQLRESYENNILSGCIVNNLYWLTTISNNFPSPYLLDNKDMIQLHISSLIDETVYLKKDLLNNSSYYFNTSIASSSIKDNTKDGFFEVMSAYNKAANFVEFISNWFRNEVEGNYD